MPVDVGRFGVKSSSLSFEKKSESRGFCPTGEGGGIDNSCGKEGGGGGGDDLPTGFSEPLSASAEASLDSWITDYADINESLRSGDDHDAADGLIEAISKAEPFKSDTVLYRGLSVEEGDPVDLAIKRGEGSKIIDDGFSAMSADAGVAEMFATGGDTGNQQYVMRVKVPAGTRAASIKSGLKEYVLPPGNSVRITRVERSEEVTYVDVEYEGQY